MKLGKTNKEIGEQLRLVYGDNALQATAVKKWTNRFQNGRNSVEDYAREGRPKTTHNAANIDRIRSFIEKDRRLTMRDIAEGTNINCETLRKILHEDLGMRKVCAKMFPKFLLRNKKRFKFSCVKNGWMWIWKKEFWIIWSLGLSLGSTSTIPVINDSRWNGKHLMNHSERKPEYLNQKWNQC